MSEIDDWNNLKSTYLNSENLKIIYIKPCGYKFIHIFPCNISLNDIYKIIDLKWGDVINKSLNIFLDNTYKIYVPRINVKFVDFIKDKNLRPYYSDMNIPIVWAIYFMDEHKHT